MIALAVVVFGVLSLTRLPMDLMPEISYPTITVRTQYPGAAPEDVEDRISRRLEQALSVVRDLRRISSVSRAESSDVILEFAWDTDLKAALQDIREKLDQTFLPDDAERPTVLRYDPSLDPVLQIGVVADMDPRVLRILTEEEIERRLETVPGVAAVRVGGGLEEEIQIEVDEELIRSRDVSLAEISQRLAEENLDQASGLLREGDVSYVVRTRNELTSLEDIARIPIRRQGESVIRLGEVARVLSTHKEQKVITRIGGRPAVKVEIYREAGANIVALAERVKERLYGNPKQRRQLERWRKQQAEIYEQGLTGDSDDVQAEDESAEKKQGWGGGSGLVGRPNFVGAYLPPGVETSVLSDQSTFIEGSIQDLLQTALLGGVLAVMILFFFLGRLAYTVVVALSIPFSIVATFAPMHIGGISLNIMSLGGLALGVGMLVDSSIVVLESIFRKQKEDGLAPLEAAMHGASEVGGAVLASTLTTIAVFFPIVFVEGVAGQVFRDQALTVVFSLVASLVAALTLIPTLAARLIGTRGRRQSLKSLYWVPGTWLKELRWFFQKPLRVVSFVLLLPLIIAYALLRLGADLIGLLLTAAYACLLLIGRVLFAVFGGIGKLLVAVPLKLFGKFFEVVERAYVLLIRSALRLRWAVVALACVSLVLGYLGLGGLGGELIPSVAQGEFTLRIQYPVGTPLATTARRVAEFEDKLADISEVASVATTVGADPEDIDAATEGEHTARIQVRLERSREKTSVVEQRVLNQVEQIFTGVSDYSYEVQRPVLFSFKTPIEVEIKGRDLERLRETTLEIVAELEGMPSLRDVRTNVARGNPEVHLRPNRDKLAKYDVTSSQISNVISSKNTGMVATRYRQGDRKVDVRVQVAPEDRASVEHLLELVIAPRPGGGSLTLEDLVDDWEIREGPAEIRRIDQQRATIVSADLRGIDLASVADSIQSRVFGNVSLPPDVNVEVGGQKKEMEKSQASLLGALLLAVFLVYVVMASQFESFLQPFIILFTIPLAVVGVVGTLGLAGLSLSIMSFIGMIVLAGIVVNNAIVLIDLVNRLRKDGLSVQEALVEAGRRRLRPILMTTMTTVLGMVPLTGFLSQIPHDPALDFIFGSGAGAEIRAPLAYTVIGGLLSSTLLTLVVIPVVYSLFSRGSREEVVA